MANIRQSIAGFTAIEVMTVGVILGILSAMAYPAYSTIIRRAHYSQAKVIMGGVAREVQIAHLEQGSYPADANPNISPAGVTLWPTQLPFESTLDYDHWAIGDGQCHVQLGFWGESNQRQYSLHQENAAPPQFEAIGDNWVLSIDTYVCSQTTVGAVP